MLRKQAVLLIALLAIAAALHGANFSGSAAFDYTKRAVDFGPRPPGSDANKKLQAFIESELKPRGCQLSEDAFTAQTPKGAIPMKNILCKFPGTSGRAIVLTGHFDTKLFPAPRKFVGASDGGSSTGLLLAMARALQGEKRTDDVYLVFFDGEEAIREQWEGEDNLYGSRHLAEKWRADGTARKIKALINVDMIGDAHLNIKQETNGSRAINAVVWKAASDLGYQAYFLNQVLDTDDDHMPFVKLGVPAIDLIDFDYPPWHQDSDTMDKLSAASLDVVGTVVQEAVHRLERQ